MSQVQGDATEAKEFDRWSDDETVKKKEKKQTKEKDFDAWSSESDASPKPSQPGNRPMAEVPRPAPQPPKTPPPPHLLQQAQLARAALTAKARPQKRAPQVPLLRNLQPVLIVPVVPWSCFVSVQHGAETMRLVTTLTMGDAAVAQAVVQEAKGHFKLSHRSHFQDLKKEAPKAVLQLVPMTDPKDQQARDNLEKYLLSKDRAGVVRVGHRDVYLIPPQKLEACGLKVTLPSKSLLATVAQRSRPKKKKKPEVCKTPEDTKGEKDKDTEKADADDTENSEDNASAARASELKKAEIEDVLGGLLDEDAPQERQGADSEIVEIAEDKQDGKEMDTEVKDCPPDKDGVTDKTKDASVSSSPFERCEAKPRVSRVENAKPRFSRQDVENAALHMSRPAASRPAPFPVRDLPQPRPVWPFPPWHPYAAPAPAQRKGRKRRRRSEASSSRRSSSSSLAPKASSAQVTDATRSDLKEETDPAAEVKWKGLLARVEALAEFCRAEGLEEGAQPEG